MASGSYAKQKPHKPIEAQTRSVVPQRATRQLSEIVEEEEETEPGIFQSRLSRALQPAHTTDKINVPFKVRKVVDEYAPHPLARHKVWLNPIVICMVAGAVLVAVLLSAGIAQRPGDPQLVDYTGGRVYNVQVGGNSLAGTWQSNKPVAPSVPIPSHSGPYSVLGKPTVSAAFINQVLASYNSPAAGKGQALYDLGVQYGIDPAFALAFFMHESTFGTAGEAQQSLSLGNLRCIPNAKCQDGYAWFNSWEDGFKAWYELIRNLYVAHWGLTTVDTIIPTYAPAADHNDEAAYIASVKHELDTWHAGVLRP
jgi:Mannosyl-glycoprotein endo-beta-N-acetylglucosaminidase